MTEPEKGLSPITCLGHLFAEEFERQCERERVTFWVWDEGKGEFVRVDAPKKK